MGARYGLSGFLVSGFAVIISAAMLVASAAPPGGGFTTPVVMGFTAGDDWEPAVASDGVGNVYVLITHFGAIPGCSGCSTSGAIMVQVSHDGGKTFGGAKPLTVSSSAQFDPQVKINSAGVVFVSYLLGKDTVVQRSDDHGTTWSTTVAVNADIKQGATDKDGLAVVGNDVYVGFDIAQRFYVSASHDGGKTFTSVLINNNTLGWPLNGAGTADANGNVYMVWEIVHKSGNAQGPQDILVTKSTDKGATWTLSYADTNLPPGPSCSCAWDFWGSGSSIGVDQAGNLYVLYNAPLVDSGSPHMWYRSSTDGGKSWSARVEISTDTSSAYHNFPAVDAGAAGDVRVAWMDNRTGAWNTWYRSSLDGGKTWSAEVKISRIRTGYSYVTSAGFAFPYGDYFVLDLDPAGHVHIAWGEGPSYAGPGNVLYSHN